MNELALRKFAESVMTDGAATIQDKLAAAQILALLEIAETLGGIHSAIEDAA